MRLLHRTLLILVLILSVFAFELTGSRAYPGVADEIRVAGAVRDSSYDASRWHTLSVGKNSRTGITDLAAHVATDFQLEAVGQLSTPIGEQLGLVAEVELKKGAYSVKLARGLAAHWALVPPDFTSTKRLTIGPSGGLMLAIAFLDSQTPGDLSGGLTVSGTGVLEGKPNEVGRVSPIAGLEYKMQGAAWVKSDLVLVPYEGDTADTTPLASRYMMWDAFEFLALSASERQALLDKPGPLVIRVPTFVIAVQVLLSLGGACECNIDFDPTDYTPKPPGPAYPGGALH